MSRSCSGSIEIEMHVPLVLVELGCKINVSAISLQAIELQEGSYFHSVRVKFYLAAAQTIAMEVILIPYD